MKLRRRPIVDDDVPALRRIYASTRAAELALTGWDAERIEAFVDMQFRLQHQQYLVHFSNRRFELLLLDDVAVGRLYVHRSDREIHVVDIALLPEYRRRGIGGVLLGELLQESEDTGLPMTLYVERCNPILSWYQRLGFQKTGENGVYLQMERPLSGGAHVPEDHDHDEATAQV